MEPKSYTPKQLAEFLQVHLDTVYHYIRGGKLRAVKLGRYYRVTQEQLDDFLRRSSTDLEKDED